MAVLPEGRLRASGSLAVLVLASSQALVTLAEDANDAVALDEDSSEAVASESTFDFGGNWLNFVRRSQTGGDIPWLTRVEIAKYSLLVSLGRDREDNLRDVEQFVDVGCGSGLHSLAALLLGAQAVISFDLQKGSIDATRLLWQQNGRSENWRVLQGSVLDNTFLEQLPKADLVYAWGSLHHTGDCQQAIANVASLLRPGGRLHMALYSSELEPDADFWDEQKKTFVEMQDAKYEQSTHVMENAYVFWQTRGAIDARLQGVEKQLGRPLEATEEFALIVKELQRLNSEHTLSRGMDLWSDARDGLGGWPNQRLEALEVISFAKAVGLEVYSVDPRVDGGPTGFNMLKPSHVALQSRWRDAGLRIDSVAGAFERISHHDAAGCWMLWATPWGDYAGFESALRLLEDGHFLGLSGGIEHKDQRFCQVPGRYSHQIEGVVFMTSDFTDPNLNGRSYQLLVPSHWPSL